MLRNKTLLAISFAVFASYVGIGMVVPVRVLYAEERGASLAIIGAMATSFLLSNFIFQYPMGWLADRLGRRIVMVSGLIVQAVLACGYIFATDPILFVVLRLLEGVVAATLMSPARALIADIVEPEKRGEAYGIFSAFLNAGFLFGPGIGSLIAGLGFEAAFVGSVVARLLAIVVVFLIVHDAPKQEKAAGEATRAVTWRELFSLPLVGAYLLAFGDYLYLGFDQTVFPIWMHDQLGASITVIGLLYVVWDLPTTILSPFGGRVADRVRRSTLILVFGCAQLPLYLLYGLSEVAWPVLVISFVHGALYAMMQPAVDSHLAAAAQSDVRARVQGIYSAAGLAGAFVGANGSAVLYEADYHLPLFAIGIGFGVCLLIGGIIIRISEARRSVAEPKVEALSQT